MVGVASALVDAFAAGDYVEEVVGAHGRAKGVAWAAVFLAAEVDGEGVLGLGFLVCVFHLGCASWFLGLYNKNAILGHKMGWDVV